MVTRLCCGSHLTCASFSHGDPISRLISLLEPLQRSKDTAKLRMTIGKLKSNNVTTFTQKIFQRENYQLQIQSCIVKNLNAPHMNGL